MSSRTPPRYVPTLTEVVHPTGEAPADAAPAAPGWSQDELVHRVMQRVEASLEPRLREALAAAVVEQTRALGPILRDEIEAVVRQAVADAFEQELGRAPRG